MKKLSAQNKRHQVKKAQKGHGMWVKRNPTRGHGPIVVRSYGDFAGSDTSTAEEVKSIVPVARVLATA